MSEEGRIANQQALMKRWLPLIRSSDHIFTWTGDGELAYLAEQATRATHIVEVGTYMGRSAKVILDANAKCHLWCVDPFIVDGTFECSRYFLRAEIGQGRCELLRKYSEPASKQLEHMRGKLDMVFIDGGHGFQDVLTDLKCWAPLVRPGGLLCGHDYETSPKNDVTKAVEWVLFSNVTEPVPRVWAHTKQ